MIDADDERLLTLSPGLKIDVGSGGFTLKGTRHAAGSRLVVDQNGALPSSKNRGPSGHRCGQ